MRFEVGLLITSCQDLDVNTEINPRTFYSLTGLVVQGNHYIYLENFENNKMK